MKKRALCTLSGVHLTIKPKKAFRYSATSGETLFFCVRFFGEVGAGKSAPAQDAAKR